jgi:CRP/FNR family cyclic AMP-dependent transcriptional regulator
VSVCRIISGLIPIFSGLNAQELLAIEKFMFFNKVEPGEYVFKEGEKGDYVCFVAAGALDVIKLNQNAQPVVDHHAWHAGGSIGEMALIDKLTRSASIRACTP